ncbi:MAG: superinfection immunity protein, partial [Rhizomicrobium sp.]
MTFLSVLFLMYWLPTIVAIVRRTPSALGVAMLNFFLGWTVIGWIIALVIALAAYPAERGVVIEGRARYESRDTGG